MDFIKDFVTGLEMPNIGAEANRQAVEKMLVNLHGYAKTDIAVNTPIVVMVRGAPYESKIDLMVSVMGKRFAAIKCAAGSLDSWERQIVAAARLHESYQVPYAVASDGQRMVVWETLTGQKCVFGLPTKKSAVNEMRNLVLTPLSQERRHREALIFRSYDSMQINVTR